MIFTKIAPAASADLSPCLALRWSKIMNEAKARPRTPTTIGIVRIATYDCGYKTPKVTVQLLKSAVPGWGNPGKHAIIASNVVARGKNSR